GDVPDKATAPPLRCDRDAQWEPRADPLVAPGEVQVPRAGTDVERSVTESLGGVDDDEGGGSSRRERANQPIEREADAGMRDLGEEEPFRSGAAVGLDEPLDQLAVPDAAPGKDFSNTQADQSPAAVGRLGPENLNPWGPVKIRVQDDLAGTAEKPGGKPHQ